MVKQPIFPAKTPIPIPRNLTPKQMDNSWPLRAHSASHFSTVQAHCLSNSGSHLNMAADREGDEEGGASFPCPFCYVDIEIPVLCGHLQEEHCFDFKNAVCPLCAANLGKDAIGHFTVQHANSVKRRKSQKSGFWIDSPAIFAKDRPELGPFPGLNPRNVSGDPDPDPDPLLSPFMFAHPSHPKDHQKVECTGCSSTTTTLDAESAKPCTSGEIQEEDYEERRQRAAFWQQLILSTIFED